MNQRKSRHPTIKRRASASCLVNRESLRCMLLCLCRCLCRRTLCIANNVNGHFLVITHQTVTAMSSGRLLETHAQTTLPATSIRGVRPYDHPKCPFPGESRFHCPPPRSGSNGGTLSRTYSMWSGHGAYRHTANKRVAQKAVPSVRPSRRLLSQRLWTRPHRL